jgi:hypothetical protein
MKNRNEIILFFLVSLLMITTEKALEINLFQLFVLPTVVMYFIIDNYHKLKLKIFIRAVFVPLRQAAAQRLLSGTRVVVITTALLRQYLLMTCCSALEDTAKPET